MFNPMSIVKVAVSGVVGIGTGKIVGKIIKDHVTPETVIDKVSVTAAAWVIGAMASKATKNATNEMIDEISESVNGIITKFKTDAKLERINRKESTFEEEGLDPNEYVQDLLTKKYKKVKTDEEEPTTEIPTTV